MIHEESMEEFVARVTETDGKVHLVGISDRPGLLSLLATIEYNWYPPWTIRNDLFEYRMIKWESILWKVASFPRDRLRSVRVLVETLRLRIADGIPTILGGSPEPGDQQYHGVKVQSFPGGRLPNGKDNRNMFTIESTSRNPLHNTSEHKLNEKLVLERETMVVNAFQARKYPTPLQIYNFIYGFDTHPKWLP
jgi:hypothetical protein